ncbi:MAG: hypothetical protein WKG07_42880 [Hymenobacter sp.]
MSLDLQLRQRYHTSLDKYMQAMWQEFGKNQTAALAPAKAFTVADLQRVLGTVAKDTAFAGSFFRRYVYGREAPRFKRKPGHDGPGRGTGEGPRRRPTPAGGV